MTAAQCLFNNVICDIADYPVRLVSDNAREFVHGVVNARVQVFAINRIMGAAYHPQAQSAVDRPHREYNTLC